MVSLLKSILGAPAFTAIMGALTVACWVIRFFTSSENPWHKIADGVYELFLGGSATSVGVQLMRSSSALRAGGTSEEAPPAPYVAGEQSAPEEDAQGKP